MPLLSKHNITCTQSLWFQAELALIAKEIIYNWLFCIMITICIFKSLSQTIYWQETVPEDIYPFKLIKEDGIHGSCTTYHTRVNITEDIRSGDNSALVSLQQAIDK